MSQPLNYGKGREGSRRFRLARGFPGVPGPAFIAPEGGVRSPWKRLYLQRQLLGDGCAQVDGVANQRLGRFFAIR